MLARALQTGAIPSEVTLITPHSFPALESIKPASAKTSHAGA